MFDKIFKALCLTHPTTGQRDVMITLVVFAVVICAIKFVLNDVTVTTGTHVVNLGHVDSFSFGSFLAPILGAHGYMNGGKTSLIADGSQNVDDPDEQA